MAEGLHRAFVEIDAKVAGADKKIHALEMQVQKLEKQLARTGKESDKAGDAFERAKKKVEGFSQKAELANKVLAGAGFVAVLDRLGRALDEVADRTERVNGSLDTNVAAWRNTERQMDAAATLLAVRLAPALSYVAERALSATSRVLNFVDALERLPKGEDIGGSIKTLFQDAADLAGAAIDPTRAAFGALVGSTDEAAESTRDFEKELAAMSKRTDPVVTSLRYLKNEYNELAAAAKAVSDETSRSLSGYTVADPGEDLLQGPLLGYDAPKKKKGGGKKKEKTFMEGLLGTKAAKATADRAEEESRLAEEGTAAHEAFIDTLEEEALMESELRTMRAEAAAEREESMGYELTAIATRTEAMREAFDTEIEIATMRGQEHEAEVLRIQKQMALRQEESKREDFLLKQRINRENAALKKRAQTQEAILELYDAGVDALAAAGKISKKHEEELAIAVAVANGVKSMAIGAQKIAEGAADLASLNPLGAVKIATGILNVAVGGMLMAGDVASAVGAAGGAGGGGGGGGGGANRFGPGGQSTGPTYGKPTESPVPGSPSAPPPGGAKPSEQNKQAPQVNVVHIGKIDREAATTIQQGLEDLGHSGGRVRS